MPTAPSEPKSGQAGYYPQGHLIRAARLERGMELRELAVAVDRTEHVVRMYELGRRRPSTAVTWRLNDLLGLNLTDESVLR